MRTQTQYRSYNKPSWAPPGWLFGPVWTVLYIAIAVSFSFVGYEWLNGAVSTWVVVPFALNLIFNALFTPLQFRWRNFVLAAVDVVALWVTLVWALIVIFPFAPWVAYLNLPYLAWISFASILQFTVTAMNRK